jgi:RNA polymerase sigma-70 factor (ECF subfamily)
VLSDVQLQIERADGAGQTAPEVDFRGVLSEYGPALARLAANYEAVDSRREELMQEIALAIWRALPRFRGDCSVRTFIYRIAHNRGLEHAWRRPPIHQAIDSLPESAHPPDPGPLPEQAAAERDQRSLLMRAVHSLPLPHRQVVMLMLEDLSAAEIGEILGISENNVAVRLNRARAALKQALGDHR